MTYYRALHDLFSSGCWLWAGRREGDVTMTKLRMRRGIGHRRAADLVPPRWLGVSALVWWALGGWLTSSPVGHGLTGSVSGGPKPRVRVRGRTTGAGPGGGAAPWGHRWRG